MAGSVRWSANTDLLQRNTSWPANPTLFTAFGRCRIVNAMAGSNRPLFWLSNGATSAYAILRLDSTNQLAINCAGSGTTQVVASVTTGAWFSWYVVCNGAGAGALTVGFRYDTDPAWTTVSVTPDSFTAGQLFFGSVNTSNWTDCEMRDCLLWDGSALSQAQMTTQRGQSPTPVTTTNLWVDLPLTSAASAGTDTSAGGHNFTATGLTDSASIPPILSNLTLALTGASMTVSRGTIAPATAKALTGASMTAARGTITPALAKTPTGASLAATAGSVAGVRTIAVTGAALTAAAGSIAGSIAFGLTGAGLAAAAGNVASDAAFGLTGAAATAAAGNAVRLVDPSLTGANVTASLGSVGPTSAPVLAGQGATFTPGTIAPMRSVSVNGQPAGLTGGSLAYLLSAPLTGRALTLAGGTVTATAGSSVSVGLTGASMVLAAGSVGVTRAVALAGIAMVSARGSLSAALAVGITGAGVGASSGAIVSARSAGLTGAALTAVAGSIAESIARALTGAGASFTPGAVTAVVERIVPLVGLSLTFAPGALTPTQGANVPLLGSRIQTAQGILRALTWVPAAEAVPLRDLEGLPASYNSRTQVLAGQGALVAGPDGVAMGSFAWVDPTTGQASNLRTSAAQVQGFVLAQGGTWSRVYFERGRWRVRAGLPVTLVTRGEYWGRFEGGAVAGQRVHARLIDGALVSGYADGAEPTPYRTLRSCAPGELTTISSWSTTTP